MSAARELEYGAHLPLIDLGRPRSLPALTAYARAASRLGYRYLCANDHLVFGRPWLDGPTALASVIEASGDLTLVTTAALPVLRGPVPLAKALAAIDVLSGGRLVAGVGPGSSADDYAAAGNTPWSTGLGRQLGLAGGAAAGRPARRRLARLGLQHHSRPLPPGP